MFGVFKVWSSDLSIQMKFSTDTNDISLVAQISTDFWATNQLKLHKSAAKRSFLNVFCLRFFSLEFYFIFWSEWYNVINYTLYVMKGPAWRCLVLRVLLGFFARFPWQLFSKKTYAFTTELELSVITGGIKCAILKKALKSLILWLVYVFSAKRQ